MSLFCVLYHRSRNSTADHTWCNFNTNFVSVIVPHPFCTVLDYLFRSQVCFTYIAISFVILSFMSIKCLSFFTKNAQAFMLETRMHQRLSCHITQCQSSRKVIVIT